MLRLESMSCGYGPFQAVHDLSFEVAEGSIFALVGANGAGKSSTIMTIAGHVELQGGVIKFDGEDISTLAARDRVRKGIALAPEGRRLFPDLTVAENLIVGGYSRPAAETTATRDMVFGLFPRLAERSTQYAGSMSGGEQQMLAIGRALMAHPRFLMIDEVSLGLMPKVVDICYSAISRLKQSGLTVLLVEQSTQRALEVADTICVLESGRPVWQGGVAEARADPGMIDAYLGLAREQET
ncbi:MAG: ABC transporter ATP-binding protein [Alphaproteobacteria bacterium]|nr:ABC transporter ATP-binding protein [Alphaproteobacteria bacterium]